MRFWGNRNAVFVCPHVVCRTAYRQPKCGFHFCFLHFEKALIITEMRFWIFVGNIKDRKQQFCCLRPSFFEFFRLRYFLNQVTSVDDDASGSIIPVYRQVAGRRYLCDRACQTNFWYSVSDPEKLNPASFWKFCSFLLQIDVVKYPHFSSFQSASDSLSSPVKIRKKTSSFLSW